MTISDICRDFRLPWFGGEGAESDIVMGSRVSLSRNFDRLPFPKHASSRQLAEAQQRAGYALSELPLMKSGIESLTEEERGVLTEKQLASHRIMKSPEYRSVYISEDESESVMVNSEDHLTVSVMAPGLDLLSPLARAFEIDDMIESKADIAFDEKMGYLTARHMDLGTGLRASALLHLPGLSYTRNMGNIISASQQAGFSVSGLYVEGDDTPGNIFIVSNQITIGLAEKTIIDNLRNAAREIVNHERRAREAIMTNSREKLEDAVWRSYGILRYARSLGESEAMELLSKARLGADMGIIRTRLRFPDAIVASRPSFISNLSGEGKLSPQDTEIKRAGIIRKMLGEG